MEEKNKLELDPKTKGLVFYPASFPSKQINMIGPFYWRDKAWRQRVPTVSKFLVDGVCRLFSDVQISPEVLQQIKPKHVQLPLEIAEHSEILPFQKEAIQFLVGAKRGMLCLAPGLGKSLCTIFAADAAELKHVLVISPLSLLYNWKAEIAKWGSGSVDICHKTAVAAPVARWVITNYDTVRLHPENFKMTWDCIIIDESILIKNRKALRTKTIKKLVMQTKPEYVWLLSGAPTSKLYDDLWAQLNVLLPARFGSYWRFAERYCFVEQSHWGWEILANKPGAAVALLKDLGDMYFARTHSQVLPELPDWIFSDVYIPMGETQDKMYIEMEDTFVAQLEDGNTLLAPNMLAQLMRLIQIASNPILIGGAKGSAKWDAVEELLQFEQLPAIIWTSFVKTADIITKRLEKKYKVARLAAQHSPTQRQDIVNKFQAGKLDVLITNPQIGRFGLTLTAARTVIYLERTYDGDAYYQSLYRVKRIGTKYSPHVIHLITKRLDGGNTVDYVISRVLEAKKKNVMAITTGELKKLFRKEL